MADGTARQVNILHLKVSFLTFNVQQQEIESLESQMSLGLWLLGINMVTRLTSVCAIRISRIRILSRSCRGRGKYFIIHNILFTDRQTDRRGVESNEPDN